MLIGASCEEFCEEMNRTAIVVNFYDSEDTPLSVTATIIGIENDSILYPCQDPTISTQRNFTQVMLPLNPAADIMSFSIQNGDEPADIIVFRYTRHTGLISPECGCVSFAEIQEVEIITQNTITDLVVTNPSVTTVTYRQGIPNAENIRIYY